MKHCRNLLVFCFAFWVSWLSVSCIDDEFDANINALRINDSWLFLDPDAANVDDVEKALIGGENVAGSLRIALPHCVPNSIGSAAKKTPVYYYKKLLVPDYMSGKRVSLYFEGVSGEADVWCNGSLLGSFRNVYEPFVADFSPIRGENSIVIRFKDRGVVNAGVWLCAQDSLSFTNVAENLDFDSDVAVSTFDINENSGSVAIRANVRNSYNKARKVRLEYSILDHNKRVLHKGFVRGEAPKDGFVSLVDSLELNGITLWDIDNPWIYTLEASLVSDGTICDVRTVDFGFRNIEILNGCIRINGKERYLMGVNTKHHYPYVGTSLSAKAFWRDAFRIKRGGFDFVNVGSHPHPNAFLSACDHYGILVLDTCCDYRSDVRANHPCILRLPDSRGVRVYGKSVAAGVDDDEQVLVNQANVLAESHNSNRMAKTFGDALYSAFDGDCDIMNGTMSITRIPKFSYLFYQSQRDIDDDNLQAFAEPFCNVLSRWIPGESNGVVVCTNCSSVELFVDGVSMGRKQVAYDGQYLRHPSLRFDVACKKPGSVKAVAYIGNVAKAESTVSTPGAPVRIKLAIDESGNLISDNDIVLVHCYVLDNNGNTVAKCSDEVEFEVSGTARLLSPARVNAEAGIATCLIRTGKSADDFTISARCGKMYTVADK